MEEGGLERKLLPFCRNGKVSFWCNRGASCSCYLWQCRGALCPLEQGEPWPPAQHPVHPEFTAELSDCFFFISHWVFVPFLQVICGDAALRPKV